MTDAELKLTLFRWIDQFFAKRLRMLFKLVSKKLDQAVSYTEKLETGYAAMATDTVREAEAMEWVEGVLNHEEILNINAAKQTRI